MMESASVFAFYLADRLQRLQIKHDDLRRASVTDESAVKLGHQGNPVVSA